MYKRIIYQIGKYVLIAFLTLKSLSAVRKAAQIPNNLLKADTYQGQPILLIAMYQEGRIRPDVARLLQQAKTMGLYIIGVNNAKLISIPSELIDCYIERPNVGRDFGSYKTGFEYVFHHPDMMRCPRLVMLNDSVYYDTTRTERFLDQLIHTELEVLGATENYEIKHHLGSFCVSLDQTILKHPHFQRYWAQLKLSEVRLVVIDRGELGLSASLKRCVSSPEQFRALYDLTRLEKSLQDKKNINMFLRLARKSNHLSWPKLVPTELWADFQGKPCIASPSLYRAEDLDSVARYFKEVMHNDDPHLESKMADYAQKKIMSYAKIRSQIHINNAYLLYLGLPIIKLDGFYRGVFSAEDVMLISSLLPTEAGQELKALLFRKSYGGDTLFGWQKILYMWGMI